MVPYTDTLDKMRLTLSVYADIIVLFASLYTDTIAKGGATSVDFTTEVRVEMTRKNMSVIQLAEETGMNRHTLASRLSGKTNFTAAELSRIGSSLGTTGAELMRRAEESNIPAA